MAYVTISQDQVKLEKRIAHRGFGTVYRGTWQNQVVAVKRVDKEEGEIELKLLSKLDHQHIVNLFGVTDNELDTDIVLEFCDGGSLQDYLDANRGKHLGLRFFDWSKQAGKPIAYLKTIGVVHKDIKSPNYLITEGNILKLCDFGLAKELDATMTSATERASYPWMAPELLKDSVLSPTYDIFAYGVVVWELLTTDVPFEGCESVNVMYRICHKNERPPIPPDCPKVIANLLKQCWMTDWKKRPSMEQALSMLHKAEAQAFVHSDWKLHRELQQYQYHAHSIAVRPNGNIVTCTVDPTYKRVSLYYSDDDKLTRYLDTKHRAPYGVTVNANGIIYVTCKRYVLMYTEQGEYKSRWVAMSPDNKSSDIENIWLRGLTTDTNGQLLVGQVHDPKYMSKHRQDGSHIASIKVNTAPWYLAATSHDTIVISDSMSNSVQIVDSTGHVLHTLNSNKEVSLWNPVGICCYNDIILVCNSSEKDKHEISCFSVSAEYIGSIAIADKPYSVAFDKDKCRILVGCRSSILIYAL